MRRNPRRRRPLATASKAHHNRTVLDINGGELLVIILLAIILIGPERLPEYVSTLKNAVKRGKALLDDSKSTLKKELGPEVDWSQYDPRQYDPRRIVREALLEDQPSVTRRTPRAGSVAPMNVAEQLAAEADTGLPSAEIGAAYAAVTSADGRGADPDQTPPLGVDVPQSAVPYDPEAT